jgi:hypothetical protein
VKLGANRIDVQEAGTLTVVSSETFVHPHYDFSTLRNDIAVIRLPRDVHFTSECSFETVNDMVYIYIYIYIYIYLTAIGLTPGGSGTVHIYTQTMHRIQRKGHI